MLKGPEAYRALDEALKDIRREEDDITRRISRSSERVAKLKETELALVRELARIRLDPAQQEELSGALSDAERRARDMLARHGQQVAEREAALKALEAKLAALSEERREALEQVSGLQDQLSGFQATAEAALATDARYTEDAGRRAALDDIIAQAEKKAQQAAADEDAKSKPYRDDPLFMYLLERKYGTSDYKASPLIRYFDGQVARLVRFIDARANYLMLTAIPVRLRGHVAQLQAEREEMDAALEAAETRAVDAAGGASVRKALEAKEARIAAIDAEILGAEDQRDALTAEHKTLAEGRDPNFDDAVAVLADALVRSDSAKLLAEARQTGSPDDDAIVVKIEDTRLRISEEEAEVRDQRARLATLESRRRELEDISYEFKTERYDDPRSRFGEDRLVGDLLNEFLRGAITASTYWGQWRNSQNWAGGSGPIVPPQQRGSSSGGLRLPPGGFNLPSGGWGGRSSGGSRSSGGGFSRPRTGSSGSRKHGGFKTGGGF